MSNLPNELIDMILIMTGDLNLAIQLNRDYVIKKVYNAEIHTWWWACENGYIDIVKWLYVEKKIVCDMIEMYFATQKGHFEMVKISRRIYKDNKDYNCYF
jgi:hypothetical protein